MHLFKKTKILIIFSVFVTLPCFAQEVADTEYVYCDPEDPNCRFPETIPAEKETDADGDGEADEEDEPWTYQSPDDFDNDGVPDSEDNCPTVSNSAQSDSDINEESKPDGIGDLCDNCPNEYNPDQTDLDGDGIGNECDNDDDGDAILDERDNCPLVYNPKQEDLDGDAVTGAAAKDALDGGTGADGGADGGDDAGAIETVETPVMDPTTGGDPCDDDIDGDGILNSADPCPYGVSEGDANCNRDMDNDYIDDFTTDPSGSTPLDNCRTISNPNQADLDLDGIGDLCDDDLDGDGVPNSMDNCYRCPPDADGTVPEQCDSYTDTPNPLQIDRDRDGKGDDCDTGFCFNVTGISECLDPNGQLFRVATPTVLNGRTYEPILLRLFANRENAGLNYKWSVRTAIENATLENASGSTGYSTPFEYHYFEGAEPTVTFKTPGTYSVRVVVEQVFKDAVTGKAGLIAEAEGDIVVEGSTYPPSDACDCQAVGARRPTSLAWLLFAVLLFGARLLRRRLDS